MKVLKDNYNKANTKIEEKINMYPKEITCEYCGSVLSYEKADMREGFLGYMYIDCPLCGEEIILEDEEHIVPTMKNIKFPTHFWHISKEDGAVDCCNNESVKEAICKGIEYFRKNKDEFNWFTATGNLYVDIHRYDGDEEYVVMVTNNYYETHIPFESTDY